MTHKIICAAHGCGNDITEPLLQYGDAHEPLCFHCWHEGDMRTKRDVARYEQSVERIHALRARIAKETEQYRNILIEKGLCATATEKST